LFEPEEQIVLAELARGRGNKLGVYEISKGEKKWREIRPLKDVRKHLEEQAVVITESEDRIRAINRVVLEYLREEVPRGRKPLFGVFVLLFFSFLLVLVEACFIVVGWVRPGHILLPPLFAAILSLCALLVALLAEPKGEG